MIVTTIGKKLMVKNPRLSQEVGETFYNNNYELITRIYRRRYSLRKVCISQLNIKARLSKPLYSHERKGLKKNKKMHTIKKKYLLL